MTGLNFQIVPVGYFFDIPYQEFDVPSSFGNFTENTVDYSIGQFYIPLQLGYTMTENQNWEPAVSFGVNVNYLTSYYVRHRYSATDNSGNDRPTFQLVVTSPNNGAGRLWLTYNATAKLARNLRSGNQVYAGLSANISNLIVHNGSYEFYLKSGTETGSYTDKGSYIGLQIGYSFLRKPKLNRDSRTRK